MATPGKQQEPLWQRAAMTAATAWGFYLMAKFVNHRWYLASLEKHFKTTTEELEAELVKEKEKTRLETVARLRAEQQLREAQQQQSNQRQVAGPSDTMQLASSPNQAQGIYQGAPAPAPTALSLLSNLLSPVGTLNPTSLSQDASHDWTLASPPAALSPLPAHDATGARGASPSPSSSPPLPPPLAIPPQPLLPPLPPLLPASVLSGMALASGYTVVSKPIGVVRLASPADAAHMAQQSAFAPSAARWKASIRARMEMADAASSASIATSMPSSSAEASSLVSALEAAGQQQASGPLHGITRGSRCWIVHASIMPFNYASIVSLIDNAPGASPAALQTALQSLVGSNSAIGAASAGGAMQVPAAAAMATMQHLQSPPTSPPVMVSAPTTPSAGVGVGVGGRHAGGAADRPASSDASIATASTAVASDGSGVASSARASAEGPPLTTGMGGEGVTGGSGAEQAPAQLSATEAGHATSIHPAAAAATDGEDDAAAPAAGAAAAAGVPAAATMPDEAKQPDPGYPQTPVAHSSASVDAAAQQEGETASTPPPAGSDNDAGHSATTAMPAAEADASAGAEVGSNSSSGGGGEGDEVRSVSASTNGSAVMVDHDNEPHNQDIAEMQEGNDDRCNGSGGNGGDGGDDASHMEEALQRGQARHTRLGVSEAGVLSVEGGVVDLLLLRGAPMLDGAMVLHIQPCTAA